VRLWCKLLRRFAHDPHEEQQLAVGHRFVLRHHRPVMEVVFAKVRGEHNGLDALDKGLPVPFGDAG